MKGLARGAIPARLLPLAEAVAEKKVFRGGQIGRGRRGQCRSQTSSFSPTEVTPSLVNRVGVHAVDLASESRACDIAPI